MPGIRRSDHLKIKVLVLAGYTDKDIAVILKVSRRAVSQTRRQLNLESPWVRVAHAAREIGVTSYTVAKWRQKGYLTPSPSGLVYLPLVRALKDLLRTSSGSP